MGAKTRIRANKEIGEKGLIKKITQNQFEAIMRSGKKIRDSYLTEKEVRLDEERLRVWIKWLYRERGYSEPKIVIKKNPYTAPPFKVHSDLVAWAREELSSKKMMQTRKYSKKIKEIIRRYTYDKRYSILHATINKKIYESGEPYDVVRYYPHFGIYDKAVTRTMEAYRIINPIEDERYDKLTEIYKYNVYGLAIGKKECWASMMPTKAEIDLSIGRMHSDTGPALTWRDGTAQYYLVGEEFKKKVWDMVVAQKTAVKQIIRFCPEEMRGAALRYLNYFCK